MKELIKALKESLENWRRYEREVSRKDFLENPDKRNMVMHNMLIALQSSIDIGNEIIVRKKLGEPFELQGSFQDFGRF